MHGFRNGNQLTYNQAMKMSFLPGDLHLYTDEDGIFCLVLKGEVVGRFRSEKQGIRQFNEIRSSLEKAHPTKELTGEEKRELLVREIGESLTRHNSLRNAAPRKRAITRTFG